MALPDDLAGPIGRSRFSLQARSTLAWLVARIPRYRLETLEQSIALLVSTLRLGDRSDEIDEVQAGDIGARQRFFGPSPLLGADKDKSSHWYAQARGIEQLSEGSRNDHPARAGRGKPRAKAARKSASPPRAKAGDVGRALRSVYDNTLREDVPRDFLDLLGKLS